jgi:hypothetical protein
VKFRFQPLISSSWLTFSVALLLRLSFLFYEAHQIPPPALATVPFQNEVGSVAAAVAQGQGFCCVFHQPTGPTAWLAPVYPVILASIFKLFGSFTVASFYSRDRIAFSRHLSAGCFWCRAAGGNPAEAPRRAASGP